MEDNLYYYIVKNKETGEIEGLILTDWETSRNDIQQVIDFAESLYEKNKEEMKEYYEDAFSFAWSLLRTKFPVQFESVSGEVEV